MEAVFSKYGKSVPSKTFLDVVHFEQESYLGEMEVPNGTAHNTALLENVFVTLVCILNKIPVFIVGKPGIPFFLTFSRHNNTFIIGCSKSLSMQLINGNLRGPDSPKPFFQKFPQVLYSIHFHFFFFLTLKGM